MTLQGSIELLDDELTPVLRRLNDLFSGEGVGAILEEAGRRLEDIVVLKYPPATRAPLEKRYRWPDGTRSKFKSPRAQRGFFAALARGDIRIPYRRTGTLARSLRFTVRSQGDAAFVTVSVDDSAARRGRPKFDPAWVVGNPQSSYFAKRTLWEPLQVIVSEQREQITGSLAVTLSNLIEDILAPG